jgi:hypothetical protein
VKRPFRGLNFLHAVYGVAQAEGLYRVSTTKIDKEKRQRSPQDENLFFIEEA